MRVPVQRDGEAALSKRGFGGVLQIFQSAA
jgi:hypothetical protein